MLVLRSVHRRVQPRCAEHVPSGRPKHFGELEARGNGRILPARDEESSAAESPAAVRGKTLTLWICGRGRWRFGFRGAPNQGNSPLRTRRSYTVRDLRNAFNMLKANIDGPQAI